MHSHSFELSKYHLANTLIEAVPNKSAINRRKKKTVLDYMKIDNKHFWMALPSFPFFSFFHVLYFAE